VADEVAAGAGPIDAAGQVESGRLTNEDLAPVTQSQRSWGTYSYLALWIGMSSQIPTYLVAGGLIALGMSWWQAILTVAVGNALILIPILLNSYVGARYGIPFPVFARASYGVFGANLPALMRAAVACGWFGIQCWIGGTAINLGLGAVIPGWNQVGGQIGGNPVGMWISFLIFWALNIYIIYRGMDTLRRFQSWAAPLVLLFGLCLMGWMIASAKGLGPILAQPGTLGSFPAFLPVFIPALVGVMGLWATLSLNVPDFTRFAKDQRSQLVGQAIALPLAMTAFATIGAILASASAVVYGHAIWNPVDLAGKIQAPWLLLPAMLDAALVTLAVNISANVVSPSYDFANVAPRYITRRTGGMLVGFFGVVSQPWQLLASPSGFIFNWLGGYGAGMGAVAGVMIADYWIVRRGQLRVRDLFSERGVYRYKGGWNLQALAATVVGLVFAWGGYVFPPLRGLTGYGWFVGFFVAGIVYRLLSLLSPSPAAAALPDAEAEAV
jgi:nucleobase:cation symporter-1, NCS1 family